MAKPLSSCRRYVLQCTYTHVLYSGDSGFISALTIPSQSFNAHSQSPKPSPQSSNAHSLYRRIGIIGIGAYFLN